MISYELIGRAMGYYKTLGYVEIDMPWIVSEESTNITLPPNKKPTKCDFGTLCGSAEQAYIDAIIKNNIRGRFITCTPCFRVEEAYNQLNLPYFMKAELCVNDIVGHKELIKLIQDCVSFYNQYIPSKVIETEIGYDIVDCKNDIELGSYGIRRNSLFGELIYGTAIAEPRLSYAINNLTL